MEVEGYVTDQSLGYFSPMEHYPHGSRYEKGRSLLFEVLSKGKSTAVIRAYQAGTQGLLYSLSAKDGIWQIDEIRDEFDALGMRWFTTRSGKVRLLYAAKLAVREADGGIYLTHSVPHVHHDPCDRSGISRPPLQELTDFKVFIKHHNQPFATVIKAHNFGDYLEGDTLKVMEGFIESVKTSNMQGYRITSQAGGCGIHEYFFKLQDGTTLYVRRSIIPYFNSHAVANYREYERLPGVILPPEEEELFDGLLGTISVQTNKGQ